MAQVTILFILNSIAFAKCFNVDLNHPILVHGPGSRNANETLFGYSLALDPAGSVYVGAPGYETGGAVFRCDFDGKRVAGEQAFCSEISSGGEKQLRFSIHLGRA